MNVLQRKFKSFFCSSMPRKSSRHVFTLVDLPVAPSVLALLAAVVLFPAAQGVRGAGFPGGAGSAEDPYHVTNVEELQRIGSHLGSHFVLMNDIDASDTASWNETSPGSGEYEGFEPIGDEDNPFMGSLDGKGHRIVGLTVRRPRTNHAGLFGYVGPRMEIWDPDPVQDVGLVDAFIHGRAWTGGIIGHNEGTLSGCFVTGRVYGNGSVGGVVGLNAGRVENSYSTAEIRGASGNVGGLVGYSTRGTIENCFATGDVRGRDNVGGLIGHDIRGAVINSYARGRVTAVDADSARGGLLGRNWQSRVVNSYSAGSVSHPNEGTFGGGLTGRKQDEGDYEDTANFYDMEASSWRTSEMGRGMSTADMKKISTFREAGWDIKTSSEFTAARPSVWYIEEGKDYPRLAIEWSDE